jgi:uncharacterized protein with HEPN domain
MKQRTDKERLQDILNSSLLIESYLISTFEKDFAKDRLRQDAVLRRIEIIIEAAGNVSVGFRRRHPEIPWAGMLGAQNEIVGNHFKIDVPTLWDTAKNDIPLLKKAIAKLLKEL